MAIEFTCNTRIVEDILSFDAVASCAINLIEETEWRCGNTDTKQWLTISCEAKITDQLEQLRITNIAPYERGHRNKLCREAERKLGKSAWPPMRGFPA